RSPKPAVGGSSPSGPVAGALFANPGGARQAEPADNIGGVWKGADRAWKSGSRWGVKGVRPRPHAGTGRARQRLAGVWKARRPGGRWGREGRGGGSPVWGRRAAQAAGVPGKGETGPHRLVA